MWRRSRRNIAVLGMFVSTGATFAWAYGSGLPVDVAEARDAAAFFAYRDGPPLGFSGGFGEDHCQACHSGNDVNVSPGILTLKAPERYSPGQTYAITVTLTRPGMALGGFQFTARFAHDSAQAGVLALPEGQQDRMKIVNDRGVQYAYHSRPGAMLTGTGLVRWTINWTAPVDGRTVLFHAAANAANADDSQFGDFVYTARVQSRRR